MDAIDPLEGAVVPLYNPRRDVWAEHFTWTGEELVGQTPSGRATVAALALNHQRRRMIRRAEALFGLFSP